MRFGSGINKGTKVFTWVVLFIYNEPLFVYFVMEGVFDFIYRCCICRVKPVKGTGHMIVLGVFVMIRNS